MDTKDPSARSRRGLGRLAVVALVAAAVAAPSAALANHVFDDVADDHPHAAGIGWVADNGITAGCGDGSGYCPNDPVTRAQMGTFMHRLSGHAPGVAPSIDAATVGGKTAAELTGGGGGLTGLEAVQAQVTLATSDTFETGSVACPNGKVAISGGYTLLNGTGQGASLGAAEWFVVADQRASNGNGWTVSVRHEAAGPAADRALVVHALCATP